MSDMTDLERVARFSGPGFLSRIWREANGSFSEPDEDSLRWFVAALGRAL